MGCKRVFRWLLWYHSWLEQANKGHQVKSFGRSGQLHKRPPLHESQEEIERNGEYSIFTYQMRTTFDLLQELLWNGGDVEVLEPASLRREMAEMVERMWNKYKNDKK